MKTIVTDFASKAAIKALQKGEVISFPTETVYGLGVVYDSKEAFEKLVMVKKRPPDKPFTLMGGNNFKFEDFAFVDDMSLRVIKKYMPGPLTVLLKPIKGLPETVTLKSDKIGIRISGSQILQDFIYRVGKPLLVPSANKSGFPPATTAEEVFRVFNGEIPYIIKGECLGGLPSTIVDMSEEGKIVLIRQGGLSFTDIEKTYKGE